MSTEIEEKTKQPEAHKMCKCGRDVVVIRKNGVSAGRCRLCLSETAKAWPRRKKRTSMKNTAISPDMQSLVTLLKERKSEAEISINRLTESGALNGDNEISKAIIAFVCLNATLDALFAAGILPGDESGS